MRLRLGTRGSALAVGQSELVADALRARGHDVELVRIKTGGDVETGSLASLGGLGVFAAELRRAILDGRVDLAVHSLKDLPTAPVAGLVIAAVPVREDPHDVLCGRDGATLASLPPGASVGTGSPRRVAQLRAERPDLRFVDVRGNVGTRLARVAEGDLDSVVLAAAGLRRLGLERHITDVLGILPAPGQGALALECRADDAAVVAALAVLDDEPTRRAVEAERAVLAGLGGGCAAPIGALGADGVLEAGVFAPDGSESATVRIELGDGAGDRAVEGLLAGGADRIADLRASRPSRLADLHDDTSLWRGGTPLAGTRILLPRDDGALADGLRAAGAEVVAVPLQRRVALPGATIPAGVDWVVLTSPATVDVLGQAGLLPPAGTRVAAVGAATARAARAAGLDVRLAPERGSGAASLLAVFPQGRGTVAIPGSALSSPSLAEGLRAKGWGVEQVPVYTMEPLAMAPKGLADEWRAGHFDVVVITAGSAGLALGRLLGWRAGVDVVAFGPPSAAALAEQGVSVAGVAATQDAEGLIGAIAPLRKGQP